MLEVQKLQEGVYRIHLGGSGTFDEFLKAIEDSEQFLDSTKELWNLIEVSNLLNTEQIRVLSSAAQKKRHRPSMTAIVADGDLGFGLFRMYSTYREDEHTKMGVFRDELEALKWLGVQDMRDART